MLVDKQSELMSDLLFTVHQHGGDDVTWKPPNSKPDTSKYRWSREEITVSKLGTSQIPTSFPDCHMNTLSKSWEIPHPHGLTMTSNTIKIPHIAPHRPGVGGVGVSIDKCISCLYAEFRLTAEEKRNHAGNLLSLSTWKDSMFVRTDYCVFLLV